MDLYELTINTWFSMNKNLTVSHGILDAIYNSLLILIKTE